VPGQTRWSQGKFPDTWQTEQMRGTIKQKNKKGEWLVLFDFDKEEYWMKSSDMMLVLTDTHVAEDDGGTSRIGEGEMCTLKYPFY
jgi:hypothetical protein